MNENYVNMVEAIAKRDVTNIREVLTEIDIRVDLQDSMQKEADMLTQNMRDISVNQIFIDIQREVECGKYDI